MKDRVGHMLAALFGPRPMPPEEIEERVEVLEAKVEANKVALKHHEEQRHPSVPKADELDQ